MTITSAVISEAISIFAHSRLGQVTFDRIIWCVQEQEKRVLDDIDAAKRGAEKRAGALALIETIGLDLSENLARQGVELAVDYLRHLEAPTT